MSSVVFKKLLKIAKFKEKNSTVLFVYNYYSAVEIDISLN